MKVIEFGRGLRGFQAEPEKLWEDHPLSMNRRRLRRAGVSEDMIERWMKYLLTDEIRGQKFSSQSGNTLWRLSEEEC